MTRAAWTDLARALGAVRQRLVVKNREQHRLRAEGVELAARVICRTLRSRSSRFNSREFMRIVATQSK